MSLSNSALEEVFVDELARIRNELARLVRIEEERTYKEDTKWDRDFRACMQGLLKQSVVHAEHADVYVAAAVELAAVGAATMRAVRQRSRVDIQGKK